jgi:diguanylate cyclase (GGDEF)-like protein
MGHQQGDLILAECARVFRVHTREVDSVCRYGGDEFAIILPETNYEHALTKAEHLRVEIRSLEFSNEADAGKPVHVTLSIGVAAFHPEMKESDDLLKASDQAMYIAKRSGRDRISGAHKRQGAPAKP